MITGLYNTDIYGMGAQRELKREFDLAHEWSARSPGDGRGNVQAEPPVGAAGYRRAGTRPSAPLGGMATWVWGAAAGASGTRRQGRGSAVAAGQARLQRPYRAHRGARHVCHLSRSR